MKFQHPHSLCLWVKLLLLAAASFMLDGEHHVAQAFSRNMEPNHYAIHHNNKLRPSSTGCHMVLRAAPQVNGNAEATTTTVATEESLPTLPNDDRSIPQDARSSIQEFNQTVAKIQEANGNINNNNEGPRDESPTIYNLDGDATIQPKPPLSFDKYMTMQEKRVVVTIRYSENSGFKPYFLTLAKKLKASHPDILMERRILNHAGQDENDADQTFDVLVDGKLVMDGARQRNRQTSNAKQIFVSMQEMDLAISRARRRRRPSTAYNGAGKGE